MTKGTLQNKRQPTPPIHSGPTPVNTNAAPGSSPDLAILQRTLGNQAVQRLIQRVHNQPETAPKGVPKSWLGKMLANILFGSEDDRRKAPEADSKAAVAKNALEDTLATWDRVSVASGPNTLAGTLYKPKTNPTGTGVLLLSGSGGSSGAYMPEIAKAYVEMGDAVLMMDYRGFGRSRKNNDAPEGSDAPSEAGLYDDAEAMMGLMENKGYTSDNVIVHGYSLGGPIAAELVLRLDKQGKRSKGLCLTARW